MAEEKKSLKKWFENYWYYYKYHTIVALFLSMVLVITVAQCASRDNADYNIVLATKGGILTETQITLVQNSFAKYGEDLNGDGKVTVSVTDCSYSETTTNYDLQKVKRQKLQMVIMSDSKSLIYLTDEASFKYIDDLSDDGFLADLKLPDDDGKSLILSDTDFSKAIEQQSGSILPKGLRVSRRIVNGTLIAQNKEIESVQKSCDNMLRAMVTAYKK